MKGENKMLTHIKTICENFSNEFGIVPIKKDVQINELPGLRNVLKLKTDNRDKLICIASQPGAGKTSLALDIVLDAAINSDKEILIFTLELGTKQLLVRLIEKISSVGGDFWKCDIEERNEADQNKISIAIAFLQELNILIDDTWFVPPAYIEKCLQEHKNAGLVMLDYIGLVQADEKKNLRQQEVYEIEAELLAQAKKYCVPMLVVAQVHRRLKEPRFSFEDILSSDYVMHKSAMILFIKRKGYFDIEPVDNNAEIIVVKNNSEKYDIIKMQFDENSVSFKECI
ncbi:MAG: hypothetical protein E7522_02030 [Ruminococcaceae bacterium]|nr:hypothetical protein [Oscillospiraceae bacterium]